MNWDIIEGDWKQFKGLVKQATVGRAGSRFGEDGDAT